MISTSSKTRKMKKIIIGALTLSAVTFAACNSGNTQSQDSSAVPAPGTDDKALTEITPQFKDVDTKVAASFKTLVDHYLHIKNALAADNGAEAASGGKAMAQAMAGIDKALLTADQKKRYAENEDDLKEHAEHIGENASNIEHQREHFVQMSEDMYALVTTFGGGRVLYHDHCPMYNENKGAYWLSEEKEMKNPYMGAKMPACGVAKEVIK